MIVVRCVDQSSRHLVCESGEQVSACSTVRSLPVRSLSLDDKKIVTYLAGAEVERECLIIGIVGSKVLGLIFS